MSTVATDLRTAASILERDGWTQHVPVDHDGRRCAAQAIWEANPVAPAYERTLTFMGRYVNSITVQSWNDDPDRTVAQVTTALRMVANIAEVSE